ncbi:MAG TPA: tetratricopeptide repeat protein [Verrucomicrobiae bacterium]|nr:tetratricopeptide repeat protein [Verrucomicrobiae bacterium]
MKQRLLLRFARVVLPVLAGLCVCAASAVCQDSSEEGTISRGSRAELAITVRDSNGQIITSTATVKVYSNGILTDQSSTSGGRAFFVVRGLGEFTVAVEASGYKTVQKDVTISSAIRAQIDVILPRDASANETVGVPAGPVLAPKAKEELVKGLQSMRENKLDEAQKHVGAALKLAPSNPEVLYVQGILYMKRNDWAKAQTVLETTSQLDPNQARVFSALGMAFCNDRKYKQAIPPLEKSLQLDPKSGWETTWSLAKAYYYDQQYQPALKMAQQARADARGAAPQTDLLYAQCLTATGRYDDAAEVLRGFLKNNPGNPDTATAQRWLDGLAANGKIHTQTNPTP